jgi:aryl-alcohol dehydrogenase-like predicted oxidoreductase
MLESKSGNLTTSVLGFGCGSVMGRIGRTASLRAMHAAWDAGITLYDTARSYGYGEAEAVLGEFLRGKRDHAVIATKYGIEPQPQSSLKRIVIPAVRAAMKVSPPGIRKVLRRGSDAKSALGNFTVQGLRGSVERSLRALETDYVDILFLHEASAQTIRDGELMSELERLVQEGKVLRAGLYARANVIAVSMVSCPQVITAMQFSADPFDSDAATIARHKSDHMLLVGNHPFGSPERVARVKAALAKAAASHAAPADLREKLRDNGPQALLEALLGIALYGMGNHALVFSMMRPDHLRANVRALESNRFSSGELLFLRNSLRYTGAG